MHPKCIYGRGSAPDPTGGADNAAPDPLAVFERALRGREGEGRGREGRKRGEKGNEGRGGKGEGKWTLATLRTDRRPWAIGRLT